MKPPVHNSRCLTDTLMFKEASDSANSVREQVKTHASAFVEIGQKLRNDPPKSTIMVGRGSSDHAGVYGRYLIELLIGVVTSPSGLSINSLYKTPLKTKNSLCIGISQSGKSPDLVTSVQNIKKGGGYTIAITNTIGSPLSTVCHKTFYICAGPEKSVAATKSFITSMTALLQIVAHWADNKTILEEIKYLPEQLEAAWDLDWSVALDSFVHASNSFVLGRGIGYGIAREAALKFKETSGLHAEAYSSAEILHGPAAIIRSGFPVLAFVQDDPTKTSVHETLSKLATAGADVFVCGSALPDCTSLPTIEAHPLIQPILMIQSFYKFVNSLSLAKGYDPDQPPNLSKVTETI